MPVNVEVTRLPCICQNSIIGEDCISAPEVTDSLMIDEDVAIAYGTSILDAECSNRKIVTAVGHLNGYESPDTFVHYNSKEGTKPCVVTDCEISLEKTETTFKITTIYTLEREDK